MIHPSTKLEFISPAKGYGVVATDLIPKGTITWVQDDLDIILSDENVHDLGTAYSMQIETYAFRKHDGSYVLCWDHSKYVNHSFNSNCITTPYDFEVAVRDILPGEELTDDYGYLNISEPFEPIPENSERKIVYPDDLLRYYNHWDLQLESAILDTFAVNQPLGKLLKENVLAHIKNIICGRSAMDSILMCYYDDKKSDF